MHKLVLAGVLALAGVSMPARADVGYWRELSQRCAGYPSKADCDDGDMLLFSGLLCAAGDAEGCAQVRESQGPDGRWWRSPRRKGGNLGLNNSFSRDMSLGALVYLAATRDTAAATRWLAWIQDNRACVLTGPGGICLARGPYRFCTDDTDARCTLTPSSWALLGRTWEVLGLPLTANMRAALPLDDAVLRQAVQSAPLGYELHLNAVDLYLKQRLGLGAAHWADAAATLLARQPENPFFQVLAGVDGAQIWEQVQRVCPVRGEDRPPAAGHQWAWERDTGEHAWEESMGWDCLFMADLLAQRLVLPASSSL